MIDRNSSGKLNSNLIFSEQESMMQELLLGGSVKGQCLDGFGSVEARLKKIEKCMKQLVIKQRKEEQVVANEYLPAATEVVWKRYEFHAGRYSLAKTYRKKVRILLFVDTSTWLLLY